MLRCYAAVEEAPAVLVLGSSLAVMSGLRFVKAAAKQGTPVVIVNRGETRGDALATVKLELGTSQFLEELAGSAAGGTRASAISDRSSLASSGDALGHIDSEPADKNVGSHV